MIRTQISDAMKTAMREKDQQKLTVIRLIQAAIKDADINARTEESRDLIDDNAVLSVLEKMIKQRQQSITMYKEGGRPELADNEKAEIAIIQTFLPTPLNDQEMNEALAKAIQETKAQSIKDMSAVISYLREHYAFRMDFNAAGTLLRQKLKA